MVTLWQEAFPHLVFKDDDVEWQTGFGQAYVSGNKYFVELDGSFTLTQLEALVAWMKSA